MAFRKTARVETIGSFTTDSAGVRKTASSAGPRRSHYVDGGAKLDVKGVLERVAERYAISPDPSDYIYEAIRANTTNVANENHDAFHRNELLSWNTRLGMPVYMTYGEKPHHVNHRTENPKTARGVILDAHYNDSTPPLEYCPSCNHRTAEVGGRDPSGIHCGKCAAVVKDEFVEILVAVDTVKDPVFANGVRTGQLKAGSMGCNCAKTACKVCSHVARSRAEFCEHIRAGNKGTFWTQEGETKNWKRINPRAAATEFKRRGMAFNTRDFCTLRAPDGFEVRKAYEECIGVEFDEYSRVDQPADPKALQREILGKSASLDGTPTPDELRMESEQLLARASRNQRRAAAAQERTAMKYFVVRVDGDDHDTYAAESLDQAMELAMPDPGSQLEYAEVEADDPGAARIEAGSAAMWMPMDDHGAHQGDVTININEPGLDGEEVVDVDETQPTDMEDFTEQELMPGPEPALPQEEEEELSTGEMGVLPGAAKEAEEAEDDTRSAAMSEKFADAYRNWEVQVTPRGNARLVSPHGPVMLVEASAPPKTDADRQAFGHEILNHLFDHGLVRTAQRYKALFDSRFAQVVDHADDDMKEFADKYSKSEVAAGGDNDMAGVTRGDGRADVRDDSDSDHAGDAKRNVEVDTVLQSHDTDHELAEVSSDLSVTRDEDSDMRDGRKPFQMSDSALDNAETDHTERLAAKHKTAKEDCSACRGTGNCGGCRGSGKDKKSGDQCKKCKGAKDCKYCNGSSFDSRSGELVGAHVVERAAKVASSWMVSSFDDKSGNFTLSNAQQGTREVAADTLLDQWIQLDKPPQADIERRVAEKYEERLKKLYASKLAAAKEAAAAQEAVVRADERARFAQALRIIAKRHQLNRELSPLKEAMGVALTNGRTVGHDAMTGQPLDWQPIGQDLAVHLIEAAFAQGGEAQITALIDRATELMDKDANYLKDEESELAKQAHLIPPVTAASMVNDMDRQAEELRHQAAAGNMQLTSSDEMSAPPANGQDRRTNIRAALKGGTIVNANLNQYRPN